MSTSSQPDSSKLSALEQQRLHLQEQLARVEAEAAAEKARAEEAQRRQQEQARQEQARREQARKALLQQEAARVAAERVKAEQEQAEREQAERQRQAQTPPPGNGAAKPAAAAALAALPDTVPPTPPPAQPEPAAAAPVADTPPAPAPATAAPATPASTPAEPTRQQAKPAPAAAAPVTPAPAAAEPPAAPVAETPAPPPPPRQATPAPAAETAPSIVSGEPAAAVTAPVSVAGLGPNEEGEWDEEAPPPSGIRNWFRNAPPVLVSTLVHAIALMILALMTLAIQEREPKGMVMKASKTAPEEEMLEELQEIDLEPEEMPELENLSVAITEPDPGMISFADMTAAVNEVSASEAGDIELQPTTIGEIGALFGKDGKGMSDIGDGLKAAATFFGAKSTGSRFIFVVDNSNSMGGGKFETAVTEMVKTVESLGPRQRFYVFFFSDRAYPLFHPEPAEGMVAATDENKAKLRRWLYNVEMCLRTKGRGSIEQSLLMRPDAIYILGDGAFTDDTGKLLTAPHNRRTVIHTVGMQVSDRGRKELTAIAAANKGTFRAVESSPAARAQAKASPIKRNNTRGKIWGLDLPVAGKKK